MSLSFVLGNLFGRALISYLLVLFACLVSARMQVRPALARSRRWYAVTATLLLTVLGFAAAVVSGGGVR